MPITGTPSSSSPRSRRGAPSAYTEAGPPERMIPRGLRLAISSSGTWCGSSSLNTPQSRTRRAISWRVLPAVVEHHDLLPLAAASIGRRVAGVRLGAP